ncbi:MAG: hypothetical protein LIO56_02065, partial [Lachnospiraceae bacterium]|nr:hypothetical protein [Lachnospiraceae bacterium]
MAKDNGGYGLGEEIDQSILDDYESEDFVIEGVADDFDTLELSGVEGGFDRDKEDSFLHPDEKLQDWNFGGLQMEKHSRQAHTDKKKKKQDESESDQEAAAAPEPESTAEETPEPATEPEMTPEYESEPAPEPEPEEEPTAEKAAEEEEDEWLDEP